MLYQTHARIHMDNIRFNISGIRKVIGTDRKLLISVKANAYGHGAVEISRLAEEMGVDWLGLATVPGGMLLRKSGIKLPILKFSPAFEEEMQAAIQNDLTLTVCELDNITTLQKACEVEEKQLNVHLKIDSGMGRIGASTSEAGKIALYIEEKCPNLILEGIYTH